MKSTFEKQIANPLGEAKPSASAGVKNVIKAVDSILFPSLGFLPSNNGQLEQEAMHIHKHPIYLPSL